MTAGATAGATTAGEVTVDARERVLQVIHERRAVRSYTDEPVDDGTIDRLLDAATWAPSAVNVQPWAFGIIRDRARLERYAERARAIYLSDPPAGELASMPRPMLETLRAFVSAPGYDMFHGAPALITIYATTAEGVTDCFLAAENLMLAASAMGLGTCPIGLALPLMNQDDMKHELGVPANATAALPIVVGSPAEPPSIPSRNPPVVLYRQ